jgi:glycosyltransferase A (GT-A) superfamily protein (DUF2064 family)
MVKNKLESCLGDEQAALLARAFLLDAMATALRVHGSETRLAYWPPEAESEFEKIIFLFQDEEQDERLSARANAITLVSQSGRDAGERIMNLSNEFFNNGAARILFICYDNPLLDPALLEAAFELLKRSKAVIGPTFDGGFYLLGLSEPYPSLFEGIDWNADTPYRQFVEKLNSDASNWQELELSYDVDRPEELEQLYFDIDNLRLAGKDDICCHTEKYLANLRK